MVHLTKTPSMSSMMNKKKSSSHNKQKNGSTNSTGTTTSTSTKEKTTNTTSSSRSTPNKNKQKTPSTADNNSVSSKSASFLKEVTASLESMLGTRSPTSPISGTTVTQRSRINEDRESINDDDTTNSCGFEVAMTDNDDDRSSSGEIIHEVVETDPLPCKGECISLPDGSVVVTEQDIDQLVEEEHRWEQQHSQSFSQRSLGVAGASQQIPAPPPLPPPGTTPHGVKSLYGQPKSVEEVTKIMGALPPSPVADSSGAAAAEGDVSDTNTLDRRLKYHARLIPDDRHVQDRLIRRSAIDPKSIFTDGSNNAKRREIKPRRGPLPAVFVSDFMKSLVVIESPTGTGGAMKKRWIFSGVLNGWPGLQTLEVISITCRTADKVSNMFDNDKTNLLRKQMMRHRLVRLWHTDKEGYQNIPPHIHSDILTGTKASGAAVRELRVTLRAPEYTIEGYTLNNPGYVFWYEAARGLKDGGSRVLCGQNIVATMKTEQGDGNAQCTKLHLMSHRYATGALRREMPKDRLTYHSIVVLEWDHQQYVSVIESAYLHGLSGYAGKSNWYHDKLEPMTNLYKSFHPFMICPWESSRMEIRCNDLPHCKTLKDFQQYVQQYTGVDKRFLDPNYTASSSCRLTFSTKQHIAQYLCNYIRRNPNYSEINRNCQTFAADFYGFMAGKKNIQPFHPINRVDYQNRSHTFLYNPDMFQ